MFSSSSGVERSFWAAQLGLLQVCWGRCCCFGCCSLSTGGGLRLVMCEVSVGRGSSRWGVRSDMLGLMETCSGRDGMSWCDFIGSGDVYTCIEQVKNSVFMAALRKV